MGVCAVLVGRGKAGKECPLPDAELNHKERVEGQAEAWVEICGALGRESRFPACGAVKVLGWESQRKVER